MFARALRPPADTKVQYIPYGRQVEFAERLGVKAIQGATKNFEGMTVEELQAMKDEYKKSVNPSGEVPSLKTKSGDIITESEILAEYFDMSSQTSTHKLVPSDPVKASHMRLAMKKFNDVVPGLFGLLRNQDPAKDQEWADKINASMQKFRSVLDAEGGFCVGGAVSLADVHCGPFLHRLSVTLAHYRDFQLIQDPRISELLEAVRALPEFQNGNCPDEDIIANYAFVANGSQWGKDGKSFAGRGQSKFPVTLHYFPVRGRGEALRMLLRTAGKEYVDRLYTPEEWSVMKDKMPEGKGVPGVVTRPAGNRGLPVLQLPTGEMIPETADIGRFIAERKPEAFAPGKTAEAYEMAVACNTYPLIFPVCMLASYPEEVTDAILRGELPNTYHGNLADLPPYSDLLKTLQLWESKLDGPFFGGERPHFGEFMLFTVLDSLNETDPATASKVEKLQSWGQRMKKLEAVASYLSSRPPPGVPGAHGKPGSIITKYSQPSLRKSVNAGYS